MRTRYATAAAVLLLAGCAEASVAPLSESGTNRAELGFTYTTFSVPGATFTLAWGINAGGDIVGEWTDAQGVTRGFLLSRGSFTTIEYPGASFTHARGIGPNGEVVGTFRLPGDVPPKFRSFVRSREGVYTEIAVPGFESVMAQRILPDGSIVGCVHDHNMTSTMKGVVIRRVGVQVDDIFASMHNGATPDGRRIAGFYTNTNVVPNRTEAYILDDGVFSPFIVPGSISTAAWDMNAAGDIVGVYRVPGPPPRLFGYVRTADGFVTIDAPGATLSAALGINSRGDVVGRTVVGGVSLGFIARRTGK